MKKCEIKRNIVHGRTCQLEDVCNEGEKMWESAISARCFWKKNVLHKLGNYSLLNLQIPKSNVYFYLTQKSSRGVNYDFCQENIGESSEI